MQRILAILFLVVVCAGCREEPKRIIGVVPKGANHLFWQTVQAGAIKAAQEYKLEVEWNAPALEIDSSRQISIVDSMITRHLAGIVLAPVDRKALVAPVERAMKAAIPVAIFDSDIDTKERIIYVATDNREGGRMAARELARLLEEHGKVAIIGFMAGSAATLEREEGFAQEIKANYPEIEIVASVFGDASQAKSLRETENILTRHPDLRGIFADNESSSIGAAQALKSRSMTGVRMVAFDAAQSLVEDLRYKVIDALLVQDPFRMGYESTKAVAMKLNGQTPPARIDSGVLLVNRSNLESPDVVRLLYPDIKRYLSGGQ